MFSSNIYLDFCKDQKNVVFISGVGRSGTTWLTELINYNHRYRILFEPFHNKKVKIVQNFLLGGIILNMYNIFQVIHKI